MNARDNFAWFIRQAIIEPCVDFCFLQAEYQPHESLGPEFPQLSALKVTAFGHSLLDALDSAWE
jgi:hypothetical protein